MAQEYSSVGRVAIIVSACLLIVVLAVAGSAFVAGARLTGCESCHFKTTEFKSATSASTHAEVDCIQCHVDTDSILARAKFGMYDVYGMRIPLLDPSSSQIATVQDERCLSCHGDIETGVQESGGVRIKHSVCADGRTCVDCHSTVAHGGEVSWAKSTSMNDCVTCHREMKESLKCETCHTGRVEDRDFVRPEFAVTHGPNWQETHGMGEMSSCSVCHDQNKCGRCHGPGLPHTPDFIQDHPQYSQREDAECTTCHRPAFCADCHQVEMPHPEEFPRTHGLLVAREGSDACLRCHDESDCDTCHVKHVHPGGAVGNVPQPPQVEN